eukprot:2399960-Prymnesium_polylepis.1
MHGPSHLANTCACVNELRGRGTRTWHACETHERRERGPTQRSCTKPAPARVCVNGLRGCGRRTWHACETRERLERGPTQRSSTKPAPARPA